MPGEFQSLPPFSRGPTGHKEKVLSGMLQPQEQQSSKGGGRAHSTSSQRWKFFSLNVFFLFPQLIYDMEKAPTADSEVSGVQWLWHPKAVETYLSLLTSSKNDATLEASCGALQNLTAGRKVRQ